MGNTRLAKVLMAFLMIIVFTAGLPTPTKVKRSPSDNSFFGFGGRQPFSITKPISQVQQSLSNIGLIFRPSVDSRHNNNNLQKPIETQNKFEDVKPSRDNIINSYPTWLNKGINKSEENEKGATVTNPTTNDNIKFPDSNDNLKYNKKELGTIDKELVDSIFKNEIYVTSTTEDTNTDYTTETGEYETTTGGDELLRIPAPVVATLLG